MSANSPDGFERILALSEAVKTARANVAEKERSVASKETGLERERAELVKLRHDLAKLEGKFRELVLSGAYAGENHNPAPPPPVETMPTSATPKAPTTKGRRSAAEERRRRKSTELEPGLYFADIPRKLQLAWFIHDEGVLDYQLAAFAIYGTDDVKAKARVNALMTELRREGLVTPSQGQRRYSLTIGHDELMARSRASARR